MKILGLSKFFPQATELKVYIALHLFIFCKTMNVPVHSSTLKNTRSTIIGKYGKVINDDNNIIVSYNSYRLSQNVHCQL